MKKIVTICTISAMLLVSLFAITGCKNKEENKEENTQKNEVIEETNRAEENTVNNNQNTTYSDPQKAENTVEQKESTTKDSDDKTPIDINDSKSYYFAVNGKKYFAGDKISDLASSEFTLNKTGSEKELAANGYLIGGGAVLNSDNKTVFNITPFNNTKEKRVLEKRGVLMDLTILVVGLILGVGIPLRNKAIKKRRENMKEKGNEEK